MKILKAGNDVETYSECKECGCQFTYKPGDIQIGDIYISNVPEQCLKKYGGDHDFCEIRHYRYVTCPWCGLAVKIDEKPEPEQKSEPRSFHDTYYDMVCYDSERLALQQENKPTRECVNA
mgnify:CR=1 FL=1